ncbi:MULTISPECIES: LemA family protein [Dactylosporangium]|uniref:Membrane protein n=2 Tax=Dactylosporangium TaxID=35753 RepID=A0A9W6NTJ0_9ACTN|nr:MULTISPECIES: LemA family protein [Dactylosporangium]UAB98457.1 LemA family protein [Dactylosporangium vinaceum]GLL08262.1 membrane protein [Dactylosporangium matsuzakiense]
MNALIVLGVVVVLVIVLVWWAVATYNSLVKARTQVDASWAQIDVQLKRRHSLIPNLVETVKGYAAHERGTLEAVVAARNAAAQAAPAGPAQLAQAEGQLTQALGRLFALSEAYPDLKANQNFLQLQSELGGTEEKIAYARQFYNSAVQTYNQKIQTLPANLIAGVGGFQARPYFQAAGGERADVNVRF